VDVMERERNPWEKTCHQNVIQTKNGQVLRAQYDPAWRGRYRRDSWLF